MGRVLSGPPSLLVLPSQIGQAALYQGPWMLISDFSSWPSDVVSKLHVDTA